MGRKKKPQQNQSTPRGQSSSRGGLPGDLGGSLPAGFPDPRAMENMLRQLIPGGSGKRSTDSRSAQAQNLIHDAFESPDPEQQIQLAQQALAIWPDCADAYVLLGESASSAREARQMFEQGVAAGERAIGKKDFKKLAGQFWGFLETRPYMRARLELACVLIELNEHEEAADHLEDMLRLNPNDNQGVRHILLGVLMDLDRDNDAAELIEQYDQDWAAEWHYGRALLAFRREGDTPAARTLLAEATKHNPHVPPYLAGYKEFPSDLPEYLSPGEENEAVSYVSSYLRCWKATPGAIPWLRNCVEIAREKLPKPRQKTGNGFLSNLIDLPRNETEIWHVDVRRLFDKKQGDGDSSWIILITSPSEQVVVANDLLPGKPSNTEALRVLAKIMEDPRDEQPRRPGIIHLQRKTLFNAWAKKLESVSIKCELVAQMPDIDYIHESIATRISKQMSLAEMPVLSNEDLHQLPQIGEECWQADFRQLASWIDEGNPTRPWLAIISNASEETILAQDMTIDKPAGDWLREIIQRAMSHPAVGEPHRPGEIAICKPELQAEFSSWLGDLNIECELQAELPLLDFLYDDLTKSMCEDEPEAALLDAPGVEPRHVAGLFAAAAEFYRKRPWRLVPGDMPFKVECSNFESGPWYGVVMGQVGMCEGIALYENHDSLLDTLSGQFSNEENASTISGLSLQFNEPFDIPNMDLHHAEKHGWEIAGPEAYPTIMRINPGMAVRPPLVWELCLMEACLRAVLRFLTANRDVPFEIEVPTSSGPVHLRISWS